MKGFFILKIILTLLQCSLAQAMPKTLPIAEFHGPDGNRYLTITDLNYAYYMAAVLSLYACWQMGKALYTMLLKKGQNIDQRVEGLETKFDGAMEILHRIDERTKYYHESAVTKDTVHAMVKEGVEYALRLREKRE